MGHAVSDYKLSEELRESLIARIEQVTKERGEASAVARKLWLAIPSLMAEVSGEGVTDWGAVNDGMAAFEDMVRKWGRFDPEGPNK